MADTYTVRVVLDICVETHESRKVVQHGLHHHLADLLKPRNACHYIWPIDEVKALEVRSAEVEPFEPWAIDEFLREDYEWSRADDDPQLLTRAYKATFDADEVLDAEFTEVSFDGEDK